ncbi:AAA family ATPase [Neokomagataea thailandica]|uniref:DNA repair ATPase-like protein n=1 Tax=Neokomagataea tanensis NBRC 106556 TaxID=1223519 RepID=A0ABQ0QI66_9PROT|nr:MULTISPECIES: AAA family ATPase [Neokomagataea]GBR45728.1 DNA repair ATPase-like protein [Neokomagataea tanensis NBRC 106556]
MSFYLRQIQIENFRRFRSPILLDNLGEGLNVLIAPNEAGKSTLLEAVRAAFFVRTKGQSKQLKSYVPYGDKVGPYVAVDFALHGKEWRIEKRFIQSAKTTLSSPMGRAEGEDAEHQLREQLGASVSANTKKAEPEGALGLLWVRQAEALELTAPDELVRDRLRTTLEHEVGSILGGGAFNRVNESIENLRTRHGTARSRTQGLLPEAQTRCDRAHSNYRQTKELYDVLETHFARLEQVRTRLKLVERELYHEADHGQRDALQHELKAAEGAAQRLQLRRVECDAARGVVVHLEAMQQRAEDLALEQKTDQDVLNILEQERREAEGQALEIREKITILGRELEEQREVLNQQKNAVREAEQRYAEDARAQALDAARERYTQLVACEAALVEAECLSRTIIPDALMARLDKAEREVLEKRALMGMDGARVTLSGDMAPVIVNGVVAQAGSFTIDQPMTVQIGATILQLEPSLGTQRARHNFEVAQSALVEMLQEVGVKDLETARQRNEQARQNTVRVQHLRERIVSLCPADAALGLSAGEDALKVLVAREGAEKRVSVHMKALPDLQEMRKNVEHQENNCLKLRTILDISNSQLKEMEGISHPVLLKIAQVTASLSRNARDMEQLKGQEDWADLSANMMRAKARLSAISLDVQDAERLVVVSNPDVIRRKIERLEQDRAATERTRVQLREEQSRLEATISAEGGRGIAERLSAAEDERDAADEALSRVTEDVKMLQLLRHVMDEARSEMGERFVRPVASRAKSYVEKILPGSDPGFDETLKLSRLTRGQHEEGSDDLSKGTQEQLALMVRLAFADILQQQGQPVSLILDDPLVYADDARLDLILDMLEQASKRLQIVILTCRERVFRNTSGRRLFLPCT